MSGCCGCLSYGCIDSAGADIDGADDGRKARADAASSGDVDGDGGSKSIERECASRGVTNGEAMDTRDAERDSF